MTSFKGLTALLLVLCLLWGLCACGGEAAQETTEAPVQTQPAPVETTAAPADDGKVLYTVTVVDEAGAPISGAMVQICLDACYPGMTDENGQAKFSVLEADYKVSFLSLPAGFTYSGGEDTFYFENGSCELTVTLKAEG